jgi:hypothetical protein
MFSPMLGDGGDVFFVEKLLERNDESGGSCRHQVLHRRCASKALLATVFIFWKIMEEPERNLILADPGASSEAVPPKH